MPPTRRSSQPAAENAAGKATGKATGRAGTVRSHGENQERAYIAASRRTDRNMEARMASARKASEIHQKRTGKRLRITEDIVANEEMYEEEDPSFDERVRRRELWLSPTFQFGSMPSTSGGSFAYPQPLSLFSFPPSAGGNAQELNTNQPTKSNSADASQSVMSPLSPMTPPQAKKQPKPRSPWLETVIAQPQAFVPVPKLEKKLNDYESSSLGAQDLTHQFNSILFDDPTMRPVGIKNPPGNFDFSTQLMMPSGNTSNDYSQAGASVITAEEFFRLTNPQLIDDPTPYATSAGTFDPMLSMFGNISDGEDNQIDEWLNFMTSFSNNQT